MFESIGDIIKEERERKGLSFNDFSKLTKIPAKYLIFLEKNKFDFLPLPVIKGFLKIIFWRLKIDKKIADQFDQIPTSKKSYSENQGFPRKKIQLRFNYFFYLFFLIIFISSASQLGKYFYNRGTLITAHDGTRIAANEGTLITAHDGTRIAANEEALVTAHDETRIITNKEKLIVAHEKARITTNKEALTLAFDLKGVSWMRVYVDNKKVFEGILKQGSTPQWSAEKKIKVRIGNAASVFAYLNNAPLGTLGEEGEVIEKEFEKI